MTMYRSDGDGWLLRTYKRSSSPNRGVVIPSWVKVKVAMLSAAVFYLLAVIFSAKRTQTLPMYPDTSMDPQAGKSFFNALILM